jgi:chromosome segregation ATPase
MIDQLLANIAQVHAGIQEHHNAMQGAVNVAEERLAKAMEREANLQSAYNALAGELAEANRQHEQLQRQIDQMVEHPDVKAKRKAQAEEALRQAQAHVERLKAEAGSAE